MTTVKPTRQRLDPAVKARNALDLSERKLTALDKRIALAADALDALRNERPALVSARDYAAANPALPVAVVIAETVGETS